MVCVIIAGHLQGAHYARAVPKLKASAGRINTETRRHGGRRESYHGEHRAHGGGTEALLGRINEIDRMARDGPSLFSD
jgi:hypothetical protein